LKRCVPRPPSTSDRRYAARLATLATDAGVPCKTILPPDGLNDWNDALRAVTA
jgi:hypothetical protein